MRVVTAANADSTEIGSNWVCGKWVTRYFRDGDVVREKDRIHHALFRDPGDAGVVVQTENAANVVVDHPPRRLVISVGPDESVEVQRAYGHRWSLLVADHRADGSAAPESAALQAAGPRHRPRRAVHAGHSGPG
jgi:hypothetical protein